MKRPPPITRHYSFPRGWPLYGGRTALLYLGLAPIVSTNALMKFKPFWNPTTCTLLEASSTNTRSSPPSSFKLMALPRVSSVFSKLVSLHPVSFSLLQAYSNKLSSTFLRRLKAVVLMSANWSSSSSVSKVIASE